MKNLKYMRHTLMYYRKLKYFLNLLTAHNHNRNKLASNLLTSTYVFLSLLIMAKPNYDTP